MRWQWLLVGGSVVAVATTVSVVAARWGSGPGSATVDEDSIVLLGDSITAGGDWGDLLPDLPIVNSGRAGFTTEQLVPVAAEIAGAGSRVVYVLAGTNDIRDGRPVDWTADHMGRLLDELDGSPADTTVVVQTVLPRGDAVDEVRAINAAIAAVAESRGVRVLDLYTDFDDGGGALRSAETTDGVHLSPAGYGRWAAILGADIAMLDDR